MNILNSIDSNNFFSKLNTALPFGGSFRFTNPSAPSNTRYLTNTGSTAPNVGTGSFTIEFWFNLNSIDYNGIPFLYYGQSTDTLFGWSISYSSTGIIFSCRVNTLGDFTIPINQANTATLIVPCAWNHIAIVRSGTTMSGYINGIRTSSTTVPSAYNLDVVSPTFLVGRSAPYTAPTADLNQQCYATEMTGIRISNIARYSGTTLTVPTTRFVSDVNTRLLFNCNDATTYLNGIQGTAGTTQMVLTPGTNGAGFDSSRYPPLTPDNNLPLTGSVNFGVTDTQLYTTQWNGSYTPIPFTQTNNTIEMWINVADTARYKQGLFGMGPTGNNYTLIVGENSQASFQRKISWSKWTSTSGPNVVYATSTIQIVNATWYHVAVTRDTDNLIRLFVDGRLEAISITTDPNSWNILNFWQLGRRQAGTASATNEGVSPNTKITGFRAWDLCKYPTSAVVGTQVFTPSKLQANQFKTGYPTAYNGLLRSMDFYDANNLQLCNGNILPMGLSSTNTTWSALNPNV